MAHPPKDFALYVKRAMTWLQERRDPEALACLARLDAACEALVAVYPEVSEADQAMRMNAMQDAFERFWRRIEAIRATHTPVNPAPKGYN